MKWICAFAFFFFLTGQSFAQGSYGYKVFIHKGDSMPYRILLPENYNPALKYPVVYFLHGRGERGNDNEAQLVHGSKLFLNARNRKDFPAIVIFPQCPANDFWTTMLNDHGIDKTFEDQREPRDAMKMLLRLIKNVEKQYPVKKGQVYIGGLSMGGMGVFEIAWRSPHHFAAAFAICGAGDPAQAKKMKKTAWWIFHGEKDNVVLPAYSKEMVEALRKETKGVKFTLYWQANHNSWDSAFAEPDLLPWLFSHKK